MTTSALETLTGDAQAFCSESWASRVHQHHTRPDELVGLLSLTDADHLLTETAIRTPAVRLAQDGTVLPESTYTRGGSLAGKPLTGLVDPRKLLDLFEGGASVVLQGLQRYWPPLTDFCAALEADLGHPVQANAYLTPPGNQGFAVHSDTHDVFVFQTYGSKLWEIHEDGVRSDVLLEPGLVMYLPTGTPHAARAQETASLHVTLGINQLTWRQVIEPLVARTIAELPGIDDHLPAGYADDPGALSAGLASHIRSLVDALLSTDTSAAEARQVESFGSSRPTRAGGGLVDRLALETLTAQTLLVRRRPLRVVDEGDQLALHLGDRVLRVPARIRSAVEHVRSHDRLTPGELPLDDKSRLVLARRLVREGLLRVEQAP